MSKIIFFGATSAIALATARLYAEQGAELCLIARNKEKLSDIEADLKSRGAKKIHLIEFALAKSEDHTALFADIKEGFGDFDIALVAYGSLGKQKSLEMDFSQAQQELDVNFISVVSILTSLANYFSQRKQGTIAVISSVAGDRGRQSNYIYGAAKGALTLLLQGLRNRLHSDGVQVLTIKPGFIDTPMTADVKKNFLFVKPEVIALDIKRAIETKKDVIYVPWFWRYIMMIIKIIPESIFKRLKL